MASDVFAVLDDLGIAKAHFLGYSMGGWIGWGIAKHAQQRVHSILIGGCEPLREADPSEPNTLLDLFRQGMEAALDSAGIMYGKLWTPEVRAVAAAADVEAMIAVVSSDDWMGVSGYEHLLPTIAVPCLLFVGENDPGHDSMEEAAGVIADATFVSLPGLDHIQAFFRSDLMLPHVRRFLAEMGGS